MPRPLKGPMVLCLALATLVAVLTATPSASATETSSFHIENGLTQPIYSYSDAIRETVYIEASTDSDRDGQKDLIVADVIRPQETGKGLKVPVIMTVSPYYGAPVSAQQEAGRRAPLMPNDDINFKDEVDDGTPGTFPGWLDNYFLPRGYAFVAVDLPGTRYSEGCQTVGGTDEILGAKAVVDWLAGKARAFNKAGREVTASKWTTGAVGGIGRSWRGSTLNGLATTDVPNLKTIVPMSAISSWYNYTRFNGFPRYLNYVRLLAEGRNQTRRAGPEQCEAVIDELQAASDDDTANYNAFWAERDYLKNANNVKASVFLTHGLHDYNVKAVQASTWWKALGDAGVPRKMWLQQAVHADPFTMHRDRWVPTIHRWFDYWLYGIQNNIMGEPSVDVEVTPSQWKQYPVWPAANATATRAWFGPASTSAPGTLSHERNANAGIQSFSDGHFQTEQQMITDLDQVSPHRLLFVSEPLTESRRLSGTAQAFIRAKVNATGGPLTVLVLDVGKGQRIAHSELDSELNSDSGYKEIAGSRECIGQGNVDDDGCFPQYEADVREKDVEIVTKGWMDPKNRESLTHESPVAPNTEYSFRLPLQPQDHVFKAGHRMAVVVVGTDCTSMEVPPASYVCAPVTPLPWPAAKFEVNLAESYISLPLTSTQ